jgi:hypothetical protein
MPFVLLDNVPDDPLRITGGLSMQFLPPTLLLLKFPLHEPVHILGGNT